MAFFGLLGQPKPNLHAVVDVGSSGFRTLIFEASLAGTIVRVIKKSVGPVATDPSRNLRNIRTAVFEIVRAIGTVPIKITITLGAFFGEYQLAVWSLHLAQGLKTLTRRDLPSHFENLFQQNRDVERAVIAYPLELFANGYSLNQMLAERHTRALFSSEESAHIRDLEFQTLLLYVPHEIGAQLMEMKKSLGGLPIEFIPVVSAQKQAMTSALKIDTAFLIDIGGEETALSLFRKGGLLQYGVFPIGIKHFLRGIARVFSVSRAEAEDMRKQYVAGTLPKAVQPRFAEFLQLQADIWKKNLIETLEVFYTAGPVGDTVILFGEGADTPEFSKIVRGPEWIQNFSYTSAPRVRVLSAEALFGGDTLSGSCRGPAEVNLAAGAIYSLKHVPLF